MSKVVILQAPRLRPRLDAVARSQMDIPDEEMRRQLEQQQSIIDALLETRKHLVAQQIEASAGLAQQLAALSFNAEQQHGRKKRRDRGGAMECPLDDDMRADRWSIASSDSLGYSHDNLDGMVPDEDAVVYRSCGAMMVEYSESHDMSEAEASGRASNRSSRQTQNGRWPGPLAGTLAILHLPRLTPLFCWRGPTRRRSNGGSASSSSRFSRRSPPSSRPTSGPTPRRPQLPCPALSSCPPAWRRPVKRAPMPMQTNRLMRRRVGPWRWPLRSSRFCDASILVV